MSTSRLSEAQLGEYIDQAYSSNPYHQANYADRLEKLFGANSIYPIFGQGKPMDTATLEHIRKREPDYDVGAYLKEGMPLHDKATIPWNKASRNKAGLDYDPTLVKDTLVRNSDADIYTKFDPRYLHGTQPSVTAPGVMHYLEHGQYGDLFADKDQMGNRLPFVYIHSGTGELRLLGGHHRAASALLKGEPLTARFAVGEY